MTSQVDYLQGLPGIESYGELITVLSQILNTTPELVSERLFREALSGGSNVSRAAKEFGVTPHVFNEQMQRFYENTDAFVFELIRSHLMRYCRVIDGRVVEAVTTRFPASLATQVLLLGDGIGSDSIRFAQLGYTVTYFEFPGPSSRFAKWRFNQLGLGEQITMITETTAIPSGKFDVVVCREVLEHVPQPDSIIRDIGRYLKTNGLAVITESFARIEAGFTTHLHENKQYEDKTEILFAAAGFRLEQLYPQDRPWVFRKLPGASASTLLPNARYLARKVRQKVRWFLEAVASHL
jgi:SAM-dependent methyltransferase